ncbi:MAG TPA: ATP-binding protein [Acidimicrobiales bacterium]|nr:ATP-binding protein [Acidimicrobiales bacterium]
MPVTPVPTMFETFRSVAGDRVPICRLSKAVLTDLSHTLENLVIELDLPAVVLTGFQSSRHWDAEMARYERLVVPQGRSAAVFAAGNLVGGDESAVLRFSLPEGHPFRQEWFLIVLTERFSAALFGLDGLPDDEPTAVEEMDRVFDSVWTFDHEVVAALVGTVCAAVDELDPTRADLVRDEAARFPPRAADPRIEQMFVQRVFESLEAGRRRWRRQLLRQLEIAEELANSERQRRELERLAAIGTVAASVAHELNNPLSSVALAASLLADDLTDPDLKAHATTIQGHAMRAGRITRSLLGYARSDHPVVEAIALHEWLPPVLADMRPSLDVPITIDADPVFAAADPERLRLVLANLLANAGDACGPDGQVLVEVRNDADDAVVWVHDTGSGIPPELGERAFDVFVTSKPLGRGTGLGLPLARRFAEEQGGSLDLARTGSDGTTMVLRLPTAVPVPTSQPVVDERASTTATARGAVLVVDDEPDVRALIAAAGRRWGWEVRTAATGDEAFEVLAAGPVEALLIDVHLDGDDGRHVLDRLAQADPGLRRRAAFITGGLATEPVRLSVGEAPVLEKPFSLGDLAALLDRLAES